MSEQRARAIAHAFVATELGAVPEWVSVRYDGEPRAVWILMYKTPAAPGEVVDPSHLVVVVDVHTESARFFPTM